MLFSPIDAHLAQLLLYLLFSTSNEITDSEQVKSTQHGDWAQVIFTQP